MDPVILYVVAALAGIAAGAFIPVAPIMGLTLALILAVGVTMKIVGPERSKMGEGFRSALTAAAVLVVATWLVAGLVHIDWSSVSAPFRAVLDEAVMSFHRYAVPRY